MKDKLRELIGIIADWELPETGETWPSGNPVSYEANVGSLGVRDYMRSIATKALTILDAEGVAVPIGYADPRSIQGYTLGQYGDFRVSDQSKLRSVPLYDHTHPARSGVVSDEDVRDAERLDWLSLHPCISTGMHVDGEPSGCVFWGIACVEDMSFRQAIDAAIQGERHDP